MPHLVSAIRTVSRVKIKNHNEVVKTLIEKEMQNLELVKHYLSEYGRKQSWEFRNEPAGPELNANALALNLLVGVEGLYCCSHKALIPSKSVDKS